MLSESGLPFSFKTRGKYLNGDKEMMINNSSNFQFLHLI
jgi:hypothetical protein